MYYVKPNLKEKKKMSSTNYYTINMSFRRGDGDMDVFTSRRFKTKSHAVRAMHKMRKYGFRRSLNETWTAKYNLVTYTRYGDVVECEDYSSVRHADMEIVGTSLPFERNINMTVSAPKPPTPSAHTHSSTDIFSKYTLEEYGKGYLMRPPRGDANWGMKYFYVDGGCGWWNAKQNAWFFQSKYLQCLLDNGVQTSISSSSTNKTRSVSNSTQTRRSKRLNGSKTLHEAKIRSIEKRKRFERLNSLADELVKSRRSRRSIVSSAYDSDEDSDYVPPVEEEESEEYVPDAEEDEDGELLFSNYTVRPYKRGFLLVPEEGDENWGEKYFHDGWWMPTQDAWFFRSKYYDFLVENGARSADDETPVAEDSDLIAQTRDGRVQLRKYGRGVVLTVPKSHPNYGDPYYYEDNGSTERGWWNRNAKGWFFRRSMIPYLRDEEIASFS